MDLDISHYSDQELIQLLGLDIVTEESVRDTLGELLTKYADNPDLQRFFLAIQERLLAEVKTRSVNPEQKSTITRIVHIDSSQIPLYVENFTSDKFSFQLSDPIPNVISISLLSAELPQSWYTFAYLKGNTRFVYYYYTSHYDIIPYDYNGLTYTSDIYLKNSILNFPVDANGILRDLSGNAVTTVYQIKLDDSGNALYKKDIHGTIVYYITDPSGNRIIVDGNGDIIVNIDYDGNLIDTYDVSGPVTNFYMDYVDASGNLVDASGNIVDICGNFFYPVIDYLGHVINIPGNYVDASGNMVDASGQIVDLSGYFYPALDASGHVIDFSMYTDVSGYAVDTSGYSHGFYPDIDLSGNVLTDVYPYLVYKRDASGNKVNLNDYFNPYEKIPFRITPTHFQLKAFGNLYDEAGTYVSNIFNETNIENHCVLDIPDGNYTLVKLLNTIKTAIHTGKDGIADSTFDYTIVKHSGKVIFSSQKLFKIMWHDKSSTEPWLNLTYTNHHLGWHLGFNKDITNSDLLTLTDQEYPYIAVTRSLTDLTTNIYHTSFSPNVLNVNGTRYIILELNDYSSNRISNNIVLMNSLPRNKVFNNEIVKQDVPQVLTGFNTTSILPGAKNIKASQVNLINNSTYIAPTGRQLITRQASNLFAKIPYKRNAIPAYNTSTEEEFVPELGYARHFCELTGSLQSNVREYLGPITLCNLEVGLYDDRGFLLGLNGMHWSCSIVVKSIYQKHKS